MEGRTAFYTAALSHRKVLKELEDIRMNSLGTEQRTAAWHALRDGRLTASSFSNALG